MGRWRLLVLGVKQRVKDVTSNRESGFGRYDVMLEPLLFLKHCFLRAVVCEAAF